MEFSKDNVLRLLDALQTGMDVLRQEKNMSAKGAGYIHGYEDALKNVRFVITLNMEEDNHDKQQN